MRYTWLDSYLCKKRCVTKDFQPVWNWIRYQIGGKMFAAICFDKQNQPYYINLKGRSGGSQIFARTVCGYSAGILFRQAHLDFNKTRRRRAR